MYAIFEAFLMLIDFHGYIFRDDFASLYRRVRQYPVARFSHGHRTSEQICRAVDLACIWYPKEVFCLQRSAVTVCLLRRHGIPAQLIVGASLMPFRAHAWVEVNGLVVNDKTYLAGMYAVLDRC